MQSLRWLAGVLLLAAAPVRADLQVAFTFDDGPRLAETPRLTPRERNEAMLTALRDAKVRAALFVTVNNGADRPEGQALLDAWSRDGHFVANHTLSHPDFNKPETTLEIAEREIRGCDAVIRDQPGYRKWFRFPYLREGKPDDKRVALREFLKAQGYRNGYVTLDTSDWRLDQELRERLEKDANADLEPIRRAYLNHLRQRANAYRDLSRKVLDRDIAQVMLLHHNLLNALFLKEAIAQFRADGWTVVDPETAYQDPVYASPPDATVAGQSLLISLAREKWGKNPPELEPLFDDGDAAIAELPPTRHPER